MVLALTSTARKVKYLFKPNVLMSTSARLKEEKIKIGKYEINYLKVGHGPHNVLCSPGSFGTMWTDLKPQIDGFDRDKFSLVLHDPVGNGKSSLPEDENVIDFLDRNSNIAYELMKALQIPYYSYMGWSSGGVSGLCLAAKHPEVINKLVVWGVGSHMIPSEVLYYKKLKDLKNWPKTTLEVMMKVYGKENFVKNLNKLVDSVERNYKALSCDYLLKDVACPTLIMYGEKDPVVDSSHVKHIQKHIRKPTVHLYPEGKHNIHIKYAEDFNRRAQDFLLQSKN